jgi:hypothetical protein
MSSPTSAKRFKGIDACLASIGAFFASGTRFKGDFIEVGVRAL